jgi:flagellin-like hook-associated protein FlgL
MAITFNLGSQSIVSARAAKQESKVLSSPFNRLSSGIRINQLSDGPITRLASESLSKSLNSQTNTPEKNLAALREQLRRSQQSNVLKVAAEDFSDVQRSDRSLDDSATLTISDELKTSSRIAAQGRRNVRDGAALLTTAESAISELTRITTELKSLAEQATSGSLLLSQREALDTEAQALKAEYARVIQTTEFNGTRVLANGFQGVSIQTSGGQDGVITSSLGGAVGNGGFQPQGTSAGFNMYPGTTGDFNGDGALDQAVADASSNSINVQLGDGQGNFASSTLFAAGSGPQSITSGDFNGDGILDLATTNPTSNTVSVIIGDGTGSFGAASSFATGASPQAVASGDINGDGAVDLAVTNRYGGSVSILLGDRTGGFTAQTSLATETGASSFILEDLNQDGSLDIATLEGAGQMVAISFGNGIGGFDRSEIVVPYELASSLFTGDFNNDGAPDIGMLGVFDGSIEVALNNGSGTFTDTIYTATGDLVTISGQTGDFNGDGFLDIAHTNFPGELKVWTGDGTGNFSMENIYSSQGSPTSVGDFNNDGVLDLATSTDILTGNTTTGTAPLLDFSLNTITDAKQALTRFNQKLEQLSLQKGTIDAFQSRLTSASQLLETRKENIRAAQFRIQDIESAQDSARSTRLSIIKQATNALEAQGIRQPDIVLRLLV